jgi:hypothetical protein
MSNEEAALGPPTNPAWRNVNVGPFDRGHYRIVGNCEYVMFESLWDFDQHAASMWRVKNKPAADRVFDPYWCRGDWTGSNLNTQQTMDKIRTGWPEMIDILHGMWGDVRPELEIATSMIQVRRRKRQRSDHGDTFEQKRVWNGDLARAWERPMKELRMQETQHHVSIYINLAGNAGRSAQAMLWRSTAAMMICEILCKAGRQVEIYVGDSSYDVGYRGPSSSVNSLLIKKYDEPLNLEKLASTAIPQFYRTFGFLMCLCIPWDSHGSYGGAWQGGLPLAMMEQKARGQLVVDIRNCFSREEAIIEFYRVRDALMMQDAEAT